MAAYVANNTTNSGPNYTTSRDVTQATSCPSASLPLSRPMWRPGEDLLGVIVGGSGEDASVLNEQVRVGSIDLSELVPRWRMLEGLYAILRRELAGRDERLLSDRTVDESQTSGRRTYMAAHRFLHIAWDNHSALRALLQHNGATQFAPWNLLRPTFEAAFNALWLLDPPDSIDRRRRGLTMEWLDELETRRYQADIEPLLKYVDPADAAELEAERQRLALVRDKHEEEYRAEAAKLGMRWPLPKSINLIDELGRLVHNSEFEGSELLYRSTWRTLSGMQHGRGSTMLRGSQQSGEEAIPGGMRMMLSIKDEVFLGAANVTNGLHMQAVMLLTQRTAARTHS